MIIHARFATSIPDRAKGLIGEQHIQPLFFKTRFGIHTIGMKQSIDVVILNKRDVIVKLKKSLKPNSLFFWNPLFDRVLELPTGFIQKQKISVGDRVEVRVIE